MLNDKEVKEFPDVGHKLTAPKKLSAYEKERQHAEAKRLRNEAETAAALKEFQDSFGDDEEPDSYYNRAPGDYGRLSRTSSGPRSGPGSLGPLPGAAPSMKKKRALDELREQQQSLRSDPYADHAPKHSARSGALYGNDGDHEDIVPKPTLLLSSLPPVTGTEQIFNLLEGYLEVVDVEILQSQDFNTRSISAIATLAAGTPPSKIDAVVSSLRNKYVGFGYFLTVSRHLSSQSIPVVQSTASTSARSNYPYGALKQSENRSSMNKAPPPRDYDGFAPPDQIPQLGRDSSGPSAEAVINVSPPHDIATVRAIHAVADTLLSEPDPHRAMELEALLMSREKVQQDERFAFLFDSASPGGVYYRYLLWGPDHLNINASRQPHIIDDSHDIEWTSPHELLPFADLTDLAESINHIDYNSSDEESDEDDGDTAPAEALQNPDDRSGKPHAGVLLNPLQLARFTSLLADLPTSRARLRNSDVSGITYFAIKHAGRGADDIVDYLLLNITKPFSSTSAARNMQSDRESGAENENHERPFSGLGVLGDTKETRREDDPSDARLIGLYVIADVLSAASVAGVKNAWKYRQLIEAGLLGHKTFDQLGRLEKDLKMGRMKAEQWKKRVEHVLGVWRGNNTFSIDGQEAMEQAFAQSSPTEEELQAQEWVERKKIASSLELSKDYSKHRPEASTSVNPVASNDVRNNENTDNAVDEEDIDGIPMTENDLDLLDTHKSSTNLINDDTEITNNISSKPAERTEAETDIASQPKASGETKKGFSLSLAAQTSGSANSQAAKRRMRAEDMFADSDED